MKNLYLALVITIMTGGAAWGLQVDVDEIKTAKRINFINYTGKVRQSDSVREIKSIGRGLAGRVAAGRVDRAAFFMKYSVTHAVSREEPEKYSADIFSIDRDARVGHIDNVRRILAGYLEGMYGYSPRNARTLSLFISYYNAIYRGDMRYITSKYKAAVTRHLSVNNAGISTVYHEWPGATKMLVPLTEDPGRGKIDSIDPDAISDDTVKKEIRKDDKLIDDRKDLVEIKKKVIERDKESIEREKKELAEKEKETVKEDKSIAEKKESIDEKKTELKKDRDTLSREKEKIPGVKDPAEKQKREKDLRAEEEKLKKKEEQIRDEEKKTREEVKKIEEKKRDIAKEKKTLQEKEKKVAEKGKKVAEEEKEVKDDELKRDIEKSPEKVKSLLAKKADELDKREDTLRDATADKNIYAMKLFYLKIREYLQDGHYNNEMYMINASTRKVEFKSPVENICGSRYDVFSKGVAVITHRGGHQKSHHLTMLSRETLLPVAEGSDDIFWRSFVEIRDGFIYAIMIEKGEYYLGRFGEDLRLAARSKERISKDTFISFYDEYIYINRWDKKILVLKKEDLSLVDTIEPDAGPKPKP